jgi:hypothetical protein
LLYVCVCFVCVFGGCAGVRCVFLATDTVGKPHLGLVAVQGAPTR